MEGKLACAPFLAGNAAGVGPKVCEDAVALAAGGFEVGGSEGIGMTLGCSCVREEGETDPPGAVVVPDVVVGIVLGAAGREAVDVLGRGHGPIFVEFLFVPVGLL